MPEHDAKLSVNQSPKIMGILNATPDSFADGGKYINKSKAMDRIYFMLKNGADIIDIGGESTRPGSDGVSVQEEMDRVIPLLESAITSFKDAVFSIDTTKYEVAEKALETGAHIINDISGLQADPRLADLCAEHDATLVLMHSKGKPKVMQQNPIYEHVVDEVANFFEQQIAKAKKRGVHRIILDPGIGFGKTTEHNLRLINNLSTFEKFGFPVLVGASRKSLIGTLLGDRPVDDRLIGTVALHYHALMKGAQILRVHDVKEASDSIRIFNALISQS